MYSYTALSRHSDAHRSYISSSISSACTFVMYCLCIACTTNAVIGQIVHVAKHSVHVMFKHSYLYCTGLTSMQ
jgi:hypothetical protein